MCGIAGFFDPLQRYAQEDLLRLARQMANTLRHRGPDDGGEWAEAAAGVAFGHRRLSIIDLSAEGHQPMASASGRQVIAFNGEVFNFAELREELRPLGFLFRGHSDTEVILAAIEAWGLEEAVRRFNGMFAIALWDRQERRLSLIRDRLGKKPLYYGVNGGILFFGSELKALRAHPLWAAEIDRNSLALFLRHNYVPTPYSIYRGIHKLTPGCILTIHAGAAAPLTGLSPFPVAEACSAGTAPRWYWSPQQVYETALPYAGTEDEAAAELEKLLKESIQKRLIADVPLGAFLSGGIDSSAVVALMQAQSSRPVKTFTIGFENEIYDEAGAARAVARHLGTEHTELYVSPAEMLAVIPKLPELYDEPFADSSQIPTFLVAQLTRRQVTVSLSGDGGDELFAGYNRYFEVKWLWSKLRLLPMPVRQLAAKVLTTIPLSSWRTWQKWFKSILPATLRCREAGNFIYKLADVLANATPDLFYFDCISHWRQPETVARQSVEPLMAVTDPQRQARLGDFTRRMMYWDLISYLPDDILTKVDRASMGAGLEARVPFLDHRLVEFAARLPLDFLIRHNQGKWLLRRVLYKYVPRQLLERPKMGFGAPLTDWLRGPLREWAETLLAEDRLQREGFLNPQPIRRKWSEFLSGERDWKYHLWNVLMFQAWREQI